MAQYVPNYTSGCSQIRLRTTRGELAVDLVRRCHEQYDDTTSAYDYGATRRWS